MLSREFAPRDRFALAATTLAIAALATLGAGLGYAQNPDTLPSSGWVVLSETSPWSEPPDSEILISALDSISLTLDVHGFEIEPVNHGGDAFQKLSLLGESFTSDVGKPELPVVRMMLAIPDCDSYSLSVELGDSTDYSDAKVWPLPSRAVGYEDEYEYVYDVFAIDEASYQVDALYPESPVVIAEDGWMRNQRYVILEIHPIRYNPALSRLRCYSSVSICISFDNPVETNVQGVGPFESVCQSVMENYDGVGGRSAAGGRGDTCGVSTDWFSTVSGCAGHFTDYLMIVEDSIIDIDTIEALAEKKSWYDCLNVAMVKVSDIASPISPQAIKDFIQDLYETQTAANVPDHHLGYVLLIGDAREAANPSQGQSQELLPAYEDSLCWGLGMDCWVPTDQWYACVSGDDYLQDLAIGRLAVGDTTELQTIASKIIGYEPVPLSESWANDVFLSCSFAQGDDGLLHHRGQVHKTELPEILDILEDEAVDIDTLHVHTYSCSTGQLPLCAHNQYGRPQNRAAVDDGKLVVLLWGHGYPCGSLSFKAKDVPLLDNAGMLPFWINMSCSTG